MHWSRGYKRHLNPAEAVSFLGIQSPNQFWLNLAVRKKKDSIDFAFDPEGFSWNGFAYEGDISYSRTLSLKTHYRSPDLLPLKNFPQDFLSFLFENTFNDKHPLFQDLKIGLPFEGSWEPFVYGYYHCPYLSSAKLAISLGVKESE